MSKKNKKKNKKVATCLACAKRLKAKHVKCPRCGRPNSGYVGKGAGSVVVPFLGKSARIGRARCPRGCGAGRAGARCCTRCGSLLDHGGALGAAVTKALDSGRDSSYWARQVYAEPDPGAAQMAWYLSHPEIRNPFSTGGGGVA